MVEPNRAASFHPSDADDGPIRGLTAYPLGVSVQLRSVPTVGLACCTTS